MAAVSTASSSELGTSRAVTGVHHRCSSPVVAGPADSQRVAPVRGSENSQPLTITVTASATENGCRVR
ncbi:hypothetical protein [Microbacterium elymi]|uniref:Uncharacterized protein n=1 Tax=Microbacterium elymi TaxID=2909587 RepID=A0ABY5NKB1_9MICO|nr:hypothetical protein [Microbacterium elymi]UUT35597.1 hypothetical protein L2X98_20050 [Microbacterium elymi]